ncbi:MAG: hypothetical protein ACJAXA_002792, partial [Candidatus Aldehydirespiratoraceae bacterium]
DFTLEWAAGNGERNEYADDSVLADLNGFQHAQIDDRAVQLRIFDGAECFDDLVLGHGGDCHANSVGPQSTITTAHRLVRNGVARIR